MSFENFIQEKGKGFPAKTYIFGYTDDLFCTEALNLLKSTLDKDNIAFNFDIHDADDSERPFIVGNLIDTLNTHSLFAEKRLLVVKNVQKLKKKDSEVLKRYINSPSPDSILLLFFKGDLKKQKKNAFDGVAFIDLDLKKSEIQEWIKERAQKKGLVLQREVVGLLADFFGEDLSTLNNELEKLSLYGKSEITADDMNAIPYGSKTYSPFQLTKAIVSSDKTRALKIYNTVRESGETVMLLGAVNWQLSQMGAGDKEKALALHKCFEMLLETDVVLKTSGYDPSLDRLILMLQRILRRG